MGKEGNDNVDALEIKTTLLAMSREEMNTELDTVEAGMLELPQVECPLHHHFGPGVYAREATFPAGSFIVGHKHKFAMMNVFLKGRMSVLDGNGEVQELVAPMIFTSPPGRKVAYVHEDSVWMNIMATEETDVETIEDIFVEKSDAYKAKKLEGGSKCLS